MAFTRFRSVSRLQRWGAPLFLLAVAVLTYGLLLWDLGFYWDDWPWIWSHHRLGAAGLLQIDRLHRPLAGEILWIGGVIFGESPLGWQTLNLLYRWLSALGVWWALVRLWPRQPGRGLDPCSGLALAPGQLGTCVGIERKPVHRILTQARAQFLHQRGPLFA